MRKVSPPASNSSTEAGGVPISVRPMSDQQRDATADGRVFVGRVGRAHGLRGEVQVRPDSDYPARFEPPSRLFTDHPDFPELTVGRVRPSSKGGLIVHFDSIGDRTEAEALRGVGLYIRADERRPLEPGEFWPDQLVGLAVRVAGATVGTVVAVDLETAQTRLEIELAGGGRAWVPFVEALVPDVDVDEGYLAVADLPGLLSLDEVSE